MATRVRSKSGKFPYEIPHIIQGGFHPERRRSDGGFLIAAAMRIPGRTQSAKAPTALVIGKGRNGKKKNGKTSGGNAGGPPVLGA